MPTPWTWISLLLLTGGALLILLVWLMRPTPAQQAERDNARLETERLRRETEEARAKIHQADQDARTEAERLRHRIADAKAKQRGAMKAAKPAKQDL